MPTFAVPRDHDIAHAVLGFLLDRTNIERVHLDGRHELTVSLTGDDVAVLEELGVVQGPRDDLIDETLEEPTTPHAPSADAVREFEVALAELQDRTDRALARVRMAA